MRSWWVVPTVLALSLPVFAQSSRDPKSQDKKNPPVKKVFTDEDLARYRPPAPPSPSPAPTGGPSGTSSRTPPPVETAPAPQVEASGEVGSSETEEAGPRRSVEECRSALAAAQKKVEDVRSRIDALNAEAETVDGDRLEKIQAELVQLSADQEQAARALEAAQRAMGEAEEEARRANPPGPGGGRP